MDKYSSGIVPCHENIVLILVGFSKVDENDCEISVVAVFLQIVDF